MCVDSVEEGLARRHRLQLEAVLHCAHICLKACMAGWELHSSQGAACFGLSRRQCTANVGSGTRVKGTLSMTRPLGLRVNPKSWASQQGREDLSQQGLS